MDIALFENNLNTIKDTSLRRCAVEVILKAAEFYNTIPSSITGLRHPVDELGEYGKVIHLKKCFHLAEQSAKRYEIKGEEYEILRTACLIHDLPYSIYYDKELERYKTNYDHPFLNAYYLAGVTDNRLLIASVYYHMGIWANYDSDIAHKLDFLELQEFKNHLVVLATQEADYYASRRDITVTGWYS